MASQVLHAEREKFDPALARSAELLMNQIDRFESLLSDLLEVSRFDADAAIPFLDDEQLLSEQSGAQQSAGGQGRTAAQQKLSGK